MTGIATILAVSTTMLAPLVLVIGAPIAAIWLAGKMCECDGRAKNA